MPLSPVPGRSFVNSDLSLRFGLVLRRVKAALEKTPGVVDAVVEVGRARGQVEGASVDDVVTAVTGAGYHAKPE